MKFIFVSNDSCFSLVVLLIGLDISGGLLVLEAACCTVVDEGDVFGWAVAILAAYSPVVAGGGVVFDGDDIDVDFCWVKIIWDSDIVCAFCDCVPLLKNHCHCSLLLNNSYDV